MTLECTNLALTFEIYAKKNRWIEDTNGVMFNNSNYQLPIVLAPI